MTRKQLQKKFWAEYKDEPKMVMFQGFTLFKDAGKSNKEKFVRAMKTIDPDQYLMPSDVKEFEVYYGPSGFNLENEGEYVGLYVGLDS